MEVAPQGVRVAQAAVAVDAAHVAQGSGAVLPIDGPVATKKGPAKKRATENAPAQMTDAKENARKKPRAPRKKRSDKLAERENNSDDRTCKVEKDESLDDHGNDKHTSASFSLSSSDS
ncbi:hypothetical protein FN846DRAFT_907857 [Sphaerosporella brunnea]|uniref:Uncharacterized protein n=1 Tax=Sphaerosporella brunnea TaxID=1250544 RepID=A0A5J5EV86_9PEZI|nr:hypothetical protein FN846DRAFT_907857 [Sphaerosporella brunnea]